MERNNRHISMVGGFVRFTESVSIFSTIGTCGTIGGNICGTIGICGTISTIITTP